MRGASETERQSDAREPERSKRVREETYTKK